MTTSSDDGLAVGVDLGGTKIALALVDRAGGVVARYQLPTRPEEGAESVLDRIAEGIKRVVAQAPGEVVGVGLGSPGQVDPERGIVHMAVNLGWRSVDVRGGIQRRLGHAVPVFMQKDANAAALGEMVYGAARGETDFMYIAVGTGLGGGAVAGGQVIIGASFFPTEIGHLSLNPDGRQCVCGQHGCAEIYVSGVGLLAGVREYRPEYPQSRLARVDRPTTADILQAAEADDPLALRVLEEGGWALGAIMAVCAAILNPRMTVLGGGLWRAAQHALRPHAERELRRRVLPLTWEPMRIVNSEVTDSALGAAALVWVGLHKS